jgi:hypothetical protein
MKDLDFIKVGSSSPGDIVEHASESCSSLFVSSDESLVEKFRAIQVDHVAILEIKIGKDSCKALLNLFKYLKEEAGDAIPKPSHIAVEYITGVTPVDDFFDALKEAVALDYSIDGHTDNNLFLNYIGA